ncbi:bifunctional proline dehydrogenase/L-glutamate gamma-semialdehyde dehydrogenase PutA [Nguyenibacter sp. L1]|uniref:bifunctional proline dehydrogenase/L-glutamate gamma-semialdehyde dehydrogenase PutA n=1 Tax=Nguyenibacter sp. L1 TaxID=3049350 RepID=UPI002B45BB4A|nr:bifunctional proline dehydrogenase/L-glutamate gamma-semialdehyde dehydrogenase PutA [Nguyenibacter sp. L1]WRH89524.1 bifunctional proline dehydrogenase/L-glutamate gamma-semialdehyde dehydrogenase PutA [Nguyenibacter sp. L1]
MTQPVPDPSSFPPPTAALAAALPARDPLRARIAAAIRQAEPDCVAALIDDATLSPEQAARADADARTLAQALRTGRRPGGVEALVQEFSLSSQEGVALMCLAEALLRIPDDATRDALIRDRIGGGDWLAHVGRGRPLFVNAAAWGLVITGRLVGPERWHGLAGALRRLLARGGEPLIRRAVDVAIRMMGEQFVCGETIDAALRASRARHDRGFRYSFDMLGEAALTEADAGRYFRDYETALHAIGRSAQNATARDILDRDGLSIKLSALHPRYARAQRDRVMAELLPRLLHLARLARRYDIGLNIDAEESERLDLSLDLLDALCADPGLAGWNGIGFVVQAYGKRAPAVLDWIIALARRTGRRIMVRLVKGAYWDSEIKKAQVDGLADFPVYTRKCHTDISYLACARKMLAAGDALFPQFATHNARTVASIHAMAGDGFRHGDYEFQCLHGMGESLYDHVVGTANLDRPCRIYAPVGSHETLLAYLVRRLLENGANSSFVNQIGDAAIPLDRLVADPVATARALAAADGLPLGAPHPGIACPPALFGTARRNSAGVDLADEPTLAALARGMADGPQSWHAAPILAAPVLADGGATPAAPPEPVPNPACPDDNPGTVRAATPGLVPHAVDCALAALPDWSARPPSSRAACLERAAALLESPQAELIGLTVREAGKSYPNAVAELREAVDFLRYYAAGIRDFDNATHRPLGVAVCISPWNFPLAIFMGQVSAALAAGNVVLAKPAEETPLIAACAVQILHQAGIPAGALQFLPGTGEIGAALVADRRIGAVMFTGSTEVARLIAAQLAGRTGANGQPVPLVAETGGQNAMIVDSSALAEQVVTDVIASAFDSAGQRCSALRVLCLQDDCADRVLAMLRGAMQELHVGNPAKLHTDIGPVITEQARAGIAAHIARMRENGARIFAPAIPDAVPGGHFLPPTLIEIDDIAEIGREIFGPVLHVLRWRRQDLDRLIDAINATGYGLTFGLHTRIAETIDHVTGRIAAGNLYVNRNTIGAVVGVQPFGGRGLSGTGPKAGGPLTLRRLLAACPPFIPPTPPEATPADARPDILPDSTLYGLQIAMPGPVGETNLWSLHPRGTVLCVADTLAAAHRATSLALAAGNTVLLLAPAAAWPRDLPPSLQARVRAVPDPDALATLLGTPGATLPALILAEPGSPTLADALATLNRLGGDSGPIVTIHTLTPDGPLPEWLLEERLLSINTAAAGGNASLMTLS